MMSKNEKILYGLSLVTAFGAFGLATYDTFISGMTSEENRQHTSVFNATQPAFNQVLTQLDEANKFINSRLPVHSRLARPDYFKDATTIAYAPILKDFNANHKNVALADTTIAGERYIAEIAIISGKKHIINRVPAGPFISGADIW